MYNIKKIDMHEHEIENCTVGIICNIINYLIVKISAIILVFNYFINI